MAFLCRIISQSKIKNFSNQFKRRYFQIAHGSLRSSTSAKQCIEENPCFLIYRSPAHFQNSVRWFAAPVQVKPKKEEKDSSAPRINDQIVSEFVRLVVDEGHSIVSRREALERAKQLNLDLVEVQKTAKPPVCKIMDYHREKYKQQIKEKDRTKVKSEVTLRKGDYKEVRFTGKTEDKDLRMKADMVKRLMERGYRVKCMARGSEGQDLGGLLSRLSALIEEESLIESGPTVERLQAFMIVRHIKFGQSKKGGGKKPKTVESNGANGLSAESNFDKDNAQLPSEEVDHPLYSSVETPEDNLNGKKTSWSVDHSTDNFEKLFNLNVEAKGTASNSYPSISDKASFKLDNNVSGTKPVAASPTQKDSSVNVANRYNRGGSNQFQQRNSINNRGNVTRDTIRSDFRIRDQRISESKPVDTYDSQYRNSRTSPNDMPRQEPSRPNLGRGIFSSSDVSSPNQKGAPFRQSGPGSGSSSEKPSIISKSGDCPNQNEPSKWGIFSRENSVVKPNRESKPG